jgi:hypothetical protein
VKAFFEFLKAQINTEVPAIKTVRMWNNQFLHSNETNNRRDGSTGGRFGFRNEKAFAYPACFVEFIINEVNSLPLGIKDYFLTVRFRFGRESYKFERLETFDFCDNFSKAIQMMAPTLASGLTFTTFQESNTEFDEDHNNVEVPYIDYRTRYRSSVAYTRSTDVLHGPVDPATIEEIIDFSEL